jgi:hypothetical protein
MDLVLLCDFVDRGWWTTLGLLLIVVGGAFIYTDIKYIQSFSLSLDQQATPPPTTFSLLVS